eukprot:15476655-Alexandrium_andersonii.AAC.1
MSGLKQQAQLQKKWVVAEAGGRDRLCPVRFGVRWNPGRKAARVDLSPKPTAPRAPLQPAPEDGKARALMN